jgi:hypothetical protein
MKIRAFEGAFAFHIRGQHEAAQREERYQTLLGQYAADLKLGMKRAHVE